jgi:hypothetical protein
MIHSMGALFVDDTNLYTWQEDLLDPGELWCQAQLELEQWSRLLNATGGALKPEKCFWYLLDYKCKDGKWTYAEMVPHEMVITNPDGTKSPIKQETVPNSKKMLGIHNSPAGSNTDHLSYIKVKASIWVQRMQNGHLPCHIAWTAYKHQLWPGLCYGLGTMTNDRASRRTTSRQRLQNAQCARSTPKCHQRFALDTYNLWRIWIAQSTNRAAYQQG